MRFKAALATVAGAIALRLAIGVGFVNYDTLYSLVWGQQLARGQTPSYGPALAPTPHPLLELLGVILAPLGAPATLAVVGRARLPRAGRARLPRLPARQRLVLLAGRARGGGADPEPLRGPELRRARLRGHPLRRARARGARDRDAPPARRLAGDRGARPRRPAAPRGLALRRRLLAVPVAGLERLASACAWRRWSRSRRCCGA